MLALNSHTFSKDGKKITYGYSVDKAIFKYFNIKEKLYLEYQEDISTVPKSILNIPFLANIMPIAWFVGFDVYIDEIDETFYDSLNQLKQEFSIHFSNIKTDTKLHFQKLIKNEFKEENIGLLFSGGLDAFESLTRNIGKNPYLITVHGADIEINDTKRWQELKSFNLEESIINDERLCYVEANLRTFYTYKVDLLVDVGWWGKIQHGMALITLVAPLSYLHNITTVLIASSNTGEVSFGWGSTSETDEKVKWANQKVIHDGFEYRRTEKIENIVKFAKKTGEKVKLRVCYSELRKGYNCSRCTKCQRTILGFILDGENPNDYGFQVPNDFYALIMKNFNENAVMTVGIKYEWQCLQDKANNIINPYIIFDRESETEILNKFKHLDLKGLINKNQAKVQKRNTLKYIITQKYPKAFSYYLKLRRKL